LRERRESLRLARSRMSEQLARARVEAHRQMLQRSLEEIDRQLAELDQLLSTGS
jgi:prefoldin subunit 5